MLVHNYEIEYMKRFNVSTMPKRLFAHAEINMAQQQQIDNDPSGYISSNSFDELNSRVLL